MIYPNENTTIQPPPPVVLCLSGHDPTGGAGIQADIEIIGSLGCHVCPVITSLTVQDTRNVHGIIPQTPENFMAQIDVILSDIHISAIKIGLIGSVELVQTIGTLLAKLKPIPMVLDPILAAGGGKNLSNSDLITAIKLHLLPKVTIITPNTIEARRLTGETDLNAAIRKLQQLGCRNVLLTGTHENSREVINAWHTPETSVTIPCPRLPGTHHGSGCTLAAAVAAGLAKGQEMETAIRKALSVTFKSLEKAYSIGHGQTIPNRKGTGDL